MVTLLRKCTIGLVHSSPRAHTGLVSISAQSGTRYWQNGIGRPSECLSCVVPRSCPRVGGLRQPVCLVDTTCAINLCNSRSLSSSTTRSAVTTTTAMPIGPTGLTSSSQHMSLILHSVNLRTEESLHPACLDLFRVPTPQFHHGLADPNFGSFAAFPHSCAEFCAFHIAHCASRSAVSALDLLRHHSGSTGLIAARALIPCVFDTCASHGPSVRYPRISHFTSASSRTRLPVVTAALITWSQSRRLPSVLATCHASVVSRSSPKSQLVDTKVRLSPSSAPAKHWLTKCGPTKFWSTCSRRKQNRAHPILPCIPRASRSLVRTRAILG